MTQSGKLLFAGIACAAILAGAFFTFEGSALRAQDKKRAGAAVPVSVAKVEQRTVAVRIAAIANVEPYTSVALTARVEGQNVEVNFKEGQKVGKGAVLFRIDPRPFQATLRQAEANLLRDTAQQEQTRSQERRYQELRQKNFVSREAYAQIRTNADTAAAVAQASTAVVENARLQLEYSTIRSPLDGYVGKIWLQTGNLVKANDTTPLVVINQVQPIYVNFAVPERHLAEIRERMARAPLQVEASPPDSSRATALGTLTFIDNAVDPSTGTIKLKAVFPNKDSALWPGQFVNASLKLYDQIDALVVPSQAVQTGPKGQYAYVVKPDMTAEMRKVELDRVEGDGAVVAKGLAKGETVVVKGQLRLAPGAKVAIAKPTTEKP